MLKTFFREMITQSNTDFSLGILLIVFRGLEIKKEKEKYFTTHKSVHKIPQNSKQLDRLQSLTSGSFAIKQIFL